VLATFSLPEKCTCGMMSAQCEDQQVPCDARAVHKPRMLDAPAKYSSFSCLLQEVLVYRPRLGILRFQMAAVLVRQERLGVELHVCRPLPLASVLANLNVVAALMDAEQATGRCAAPGISRGNLHRVLQGVRRHEWPACRRHRTPLAPRFVTYGYVPI